MFFSIRWIRPFFSAHRRRYLVGMSAALTENILNLVPTWLIALVVDALTLGTLKLEHLALWFALFVGTLLLAYLSEVCWSYCFFGGSELCKRDIRINLMRHLLGQRALFFEKYSAGDIMARATLDTEYASELLGWGFRIVFSGGLYLILTTSLLVYKGGVGLTSLVILPYIGLFLLLSRLSKRIEKLWQQKEETFARLNDRVLEGIEGLRTLRAYARDSSFRQCFESTATELEQVGIALARSVALYHPLTMVGTVLVNLLCFSLGFRAVLQGELSLGSLISFQLYLSSMAGPISQFSEFLNLLQNANASSRRLDELMQAGDNMPAGKTACPSFSQIVFSDYSFSYPSAQGEQLKSIDLVIKQGRNLGICGKTGSGKSTLIKQLLLQYPPGRGSLSFAGLDQSEIAPNSLTHLIASVSQDNELFSGTLAANLRFAKAEASEAELIAALELAAFSLGTERMKEGLNTLVGEQGIQLSGGQKQRLCLARALLKEPELLLLDDSLSAVDALSAERILRQIWQSRQAKTTILVSHRLAQLAQCEEIIVLHDGQIVERGSFSELSSQSGWFSAQLRVQEGQSKEQLGAEEAVYVRN